MDTYAKELETVLAGTVRRLQEELQGIRSSRPTVQLVEDVMVECYGNTLPVKQLGSLSVRPPREILITLWDKDALQPTMKALTDAKPGLSIGNDGLTVRVSLPPLTDERREELARFAKKTTEASRIQVRTHRDETMKRIKAAEDRKELNKDQAFKAKEKVQQAVDAANKKMEDALAAKVAELAE